MSDIEHTCPCGARTRPDSILCGRCEADLADRPEMAIYQDLCSCFPDRLRAAIALLVAASKRALQ